MQNSSMQNPSTQKANPLMIMKIIWVALFMSVYVYGFVSIVVVKNYRLAAGEVLIEYSAHPLFMPLAIAAAFSLVLSYVLPRRLSNKNSAQGNSMSVSRRLSSGDPATAPAPDVADMQKYFVPFMMRLILTETIVIYGLVLSFMTHQMPPVLMFGGVCVLNMILSFPTPNNLKNIAG